MWCNGSELGHVFGLQALLAFGNGELDLLAFVQRAVTVPANRAEVHEHIGTGIALDKPVPLGIVEPLHGADFTLSHCSSPLRN